MFDYCDKLLENLQNVAIAMGVGAQNDLGGHQTFARKRT